MIACGLVIAVPTTTLYTPIPITLSLIHIFHADLNARIRRIARLYDLPDNKAKETIIKTDKKRASYYNYYTNKRWADAESYELCLSSSELGIDGTAKAIEQYVLLKESIENSKI